MGKKFDFSVVRLSGDEIGELTNEEIHKHIMRVKRAIREARSMGYDTMTHEVEYCYLDHERQMRMRREVRGTRRFKGEK
jgi:hypothetical protein